LTSRRNASSTASRSAIDVRVIELDVVDDAHVGRYFRNLAVLSKKALSYSSPSMTKSRPLPTR
jgi:hypothetical protein